jgi:hypothetical protein
MFDALLPKADIGLACRDVRCVPKADIRLDFSTSIVIAAKPSRRKVP